MSDEQPSDNSGSEDEDNNGLEASYVGLIASAGAQTAEDIRTLSIDTDDCFRFLKTNYYDAKVCLQQYTISTGEKAPRELLTFCFDEDAYSKRKKIGHNLVMEKFFREVFVAEGSNPFAHGAYGTFVMYYMHEVEGCPCASFDTPLDIPALVARLQLQASKDWSRQSTTYGGFTASLSYPADGDDDEESD